MEDKARITYVCEACEAKGAIESEFKHKEGCKPTLGKGLKQVCTKSGKEPHASDR